MMLVAALLLLLGLSVVVVGTWLWSPAAALIVLGAGLLLLSYLSFSAGVVSRR